MVSPSAPGSPSPLHLAVALDGAGWHPAAWREPGARPGDLFTAGYWADLVAEAERGLLDLVTIEDALNLQSGHPFEPDRRTDRVRGRLDAVLIASRVAPLTRHIGLAPTAIVTHTEPFHLSKAVATLDHVSLGRAGVRVQVSVRRDAARHFGRREVEDSGAGHLEEAADFVEVLRRLWDSWEDDAEIRDVRTGRFVDREKLHHIDFVGRRFAVRGPSITPRPPQGQPIVAALGHNSDVYRLIARSADVGFVTPQDAAHAAEIVAEIAAEREAAGRGDEIGHVFGDLVVVLDESEAAATSRLERLDDAAGEPLTTDAKVFAGTPAQLADLLTDWNAAGLSGFRLRPAVLPHDLTGVTRGLVPELQRRGAFRTAYPDGGSGGTTLRGLLGLPRPVNRYAVP